MLRWSCCSVFLTFRLVELGRRGKPTAQAQRTKIKVTRPDKRTRQSGTRTCHFFPWCNGHFRSISCKLSKLFVAASDVIMGEKEYETTYKILILGDSGVGKTCLIFRFIEDVFSDSYISTIGKVFCCKFNIEFFFSATRSKLLPNFLVSISNVPLKQT